MMDSMAMSVSCEQRPEEKEVERGPEMTWLVRAIDLVKGDDMEGLAQHIEGERASEYIYQYDEDQRSILHHVSDMCSIPMLKMIINKYPGGWREIIEHKDQDGYSVIDYAQINASEEMERYLNEV